METPEGTTIFIGSQVLQKTFEAILCFFLFFCFCFSFCGVLFFHEFSRFALWIPRLAVWTPRWVFWTCRLPLWVSGGEIFLWARLFSGRDFSQGEICLRARFFSRRGGDKVARHQANFDLCRADLWGEILLTLWPQAEHDLR